MCKGGERGGRRRIGSGGAEFLHSVPHSFRHWESCTEQGKWSSQYPVLLLFSYPKSTSFHNPKAISSARFSPSSHPAPASAQEAAMARLPVTPVLLLLTFGAGAYIAFETFKALGGKTLKE